MANSLNANNETIRQNQYDILRIFAMVAVVFIHAVTSKTSSFQQLILMMAGIAVPIFFFLSGGFLLNKYNILDNLKNYYKKRFFKIIMPLIFFEIIYFAFTFLVTGGFREDSYNKFIELINGWLNSGIPGMGFHLWFMNAIVPFYLLAPLLITLRKKNIKIYCAIAILWIIFSECNYYFGLIYFPWYLAFLNYISYMMLGDIVKNIVMPRIKVNRIIFIVVFAILISAEMILKMSLIWGNPVAIAEFIMHDGSRTSVVVDPNTQQIINLFAAVMIFSFFYTVKVKKSYTRLADFCFYIYLSHYAIESVCKAVIIKAIAIIGLATSIEAWYMIIIRATMAFAVASICVLILNKIYYLVSKKELF